MSQRFWSDTQILKEAKLSARKFGWKQGKVLLAGWLRIIVWEREREWPAGFESSYERERERIYMHQRDSNNIDHGGCSLRECQECFSLIHYLYMLFFYMLNWFIGPSSSPPPQLWKSAPPLLLRVDLQMLTHQRRSVSRPFAGTGAKRVRRLLVLTMTGGDPGGGSSSCSCRDEENNWRGNIDSRQPPFLGDFWGLPLGGGACRTHASSFITLGVCFCSENIIEAMSLRFWRAPLFGSTWLWRVKSSVYRL